MFKLIKIINAGVNVPEPVALKKETSLFIEAGTALIKGTSGALSFCPSDEKPEFISIGRALAGEGEVSCYAVEDNMIFETRIAGNPSSLKVGDKIVLIEDDNGCTSYCSSVTTNGVATITDLCGAKESSDRINVKFE